MLDEAAIRAGEEQRLLQALDALYPHPELPELPAIVEEVEQVLQLHLREVLLSHAPLLFGGLRYEGRAYLVDDALGFFDLHIGPDILNPRELVVNLAPRVPHASAQAAETLGKVEGLGRVSTVRLVYPLNLAVRASLAADLVCAVFSAGYHWTREQIEAVVTRHEIALIDDLYGLLRALFPSELLRKKIWFATLTSGYGFRLIDREATLAAFEEIDQYAADFGFSTNRLVAELITTRLPREQLLMQVALRLNQCIDAELKDAKYTQEGSIYAGTLQSLYGSEAFTIFPIRLSESLSVFALFPTQHRTEIEPVLLAAIDDLTRLCADASDRFRLAVHLFDLRKKRRFDIGAFNDAVMLQPNVAGVGLNLNSVIAWLTNKPKSV